MRGNANGDWEHQYGINIDTLDNPGWSATIDLDGTDLEEKPFSEVRHLYEHETDWLRCWREEKRFKIACGATRFADALRIFLAWAAPSNRLQTDEPSARR